MSIADLIATHAQRNAGPSPMEMMSNIYSLKGAQQDMAARAQGMDAQKLAMDATRQDMSAQQNKFDQDKAERAKQFAANVALDLKNTQDPAQRQQKYSVALDIARRNGHDVSAFPEQFDERAMAMMDAAYAQVYEPVRFKAMLENSLKGDGLTEYQRQTLELQRERLSKETGGQDKTANEKDWNTYKQLEKTDPEGSKLFGKQAGFVDDGRELSAAAEKVLNEATQAYFDTAKQAREYELLADDFKSYAGSLPSGTAATISEFMKSVTGTQDEASELRRRLSKVRLSEALKYLPPGPATDRDVQEAYKGVPKENAGVEQVEMFLRGSAKMAAIDAEFQEFKANYISEKNSAAGLIPAWKQKIADGEVESINALGQQEQTSASTTKAQPSNQFKSSSGITFTVE